MKLFEKYPFTDDLLGETYLHSEGKVHFQIDQKLYRNGETPLETKPDLYLVLYKDGDEIFRTPVAPNVNFDKEGNFNFNEGEWIDMGTFLVAD